ncbi:MAG: DinB family protein [Terrimonas sp.]|nr:DinB family protein [Terrimonas sp.]OJY86257.1 MAG: hypothetical protein BGP13_05675 [Sphingobacteriales bacterium 40-81]
MEQVNKQALLNKLYQRVENHLHHAIHAFQNMSEQALLAASATCGWSIAQCLQHLNEYGDYYLPAIEKAIRNNSDTTKTNFKSSWFGAYFTKMMEPETGKKKMKAFKKYDPPPQLNAYAVVAEFIQQQEQLLTLLSKAASADLDKRIPISLTALIRLKLGDVFQFVIAHDERHVQQALRNIV